MSASRLLAFYLLLLFCPVLSAGQQQLSIEHDGQLRSFQLFLPDAHQQHEPTALLLVLHGLRGSGQRVANLTDFNDRANRHGFIVAYPDSLASRWNYLHGIPGAFDGPDDPGFLLKLIGLLTRAHSIDPGRLYVTGISNGGFMAQRLVCEPGNRFTAFASVAAGNYAALPSSCGRTGPIDALYLHGTEDQMVPWRGRQVQSQDGQSQQVTLSITQSLKFWAAHNRCGAAVEVSELPLSGRSSGTRVKVYASRECTADTEVSLYAVIGGGHNWPGVEGIIPPAVAGRVNLDIHASDVIWDFFERHRNAN